MSILLLGPSRWRGHQRPSIPAEIIQALPPQLATRDRSGLTPFDIRVALAHILRSTGEFAPAMVMEEAESLPGEDPFDKFKRIVSENRVDEYFLYWPYQGVRPGLDVEIGSILEQLKRQLLDGDQVTVFYEDDGVERRAAGMVFARDGGLTFTSLEKTLRTTYYASLVHYGALAVRWTDHSELIFRMKARAGIVPQ